MTPITPTAGDPIVYVFQRIAFGTVVTNTAPPAFQPLPIVFRGELATLAKVHNIPVVFAVEQTARHWADVSDTRSIHPRTDQRLRFPRIREAYDCIPVRLSTVVGLLAECAPYWVVIDVFKWSIKHRPAATAVTEVKK